MSEKILIIPKKESNYIYPSDIGFEFYGIITVWESDKLIGFLCNDGISEWNLIEGVSYIDSNENLDYFIEKYPNYTFKVKPF